MAINTNNPITRDGRVYDKLAVNLALSPIPNENGYGLSIAVRLTPYFINENGVERLDDEVRAVVYGDATQEAQSDPAVAQFLQALEAAGQSFIDAKGL